MVKSIKNLIVHIKSPENALNTEEKRKIGRYAVQVGVVVGLVATAALVGALAIAGSAAVFASVGLGIAATYSALAIVLGVGVGLGLLAAGIAAMFGAPSIVAAITGRTAYSCDSA